MLNVQVEILDVGRPRPPIDREHVGVEVVGEDRRARRDPIDGREREQDRRRTNGIVSRPRIKRVERKLADEEVLRVGVVEQPPARAHHRLALPSHVPGNSKPR